MQRLETENVLPLEITEINNYSGLHGLPEFSDKQIMELYKALNTGRKAKVPIFSTGTELIECRYQDSDVAKRMLEATSNKKAVKIKKEFDKEMEELTNKAIKASGYRTAQMNVVHGNGALGEIQFRGAKTNEFGEYEHIAYDLRQGKNTLGELFQEYKEAVSKLTDKEYARYNEYLEQWYNYYNRLELGLPAAIPKLPKGFNRVLSKESLEALYNKNHQMEKAMGYFTPYIEIVA